MLTFAAEAAGRLAELEGGIVRSEALEAEAGRARRDLAATGVSLTARRRPPASARPSGSSWPTWPCPPPRSWSRSSRTPTTPAWRSATAAWPPPTTASTGWISNWPPYPGAPWCPLGRAASGGELSRVMLALVVVLDVDRLHPDPGLRRGRRRGGRPHRRRRRPPPGPARPPPPGAGHHPPAPDRRPRRPPLHRREDLLRRHHQHRRPGPLDDAGRVGEPP